MSGLVISHLKVLLNHPTGPKTDLFWIPVMKWTLVLAGLKDLTRPADSLSVNQNVALTATGLIWARWTFAIKPVSYGFGPLVHVFVGGTGLVQLARIANYRYNLPTTKAA
uniref:Mitochondrial pyruvate carrier n=1 Tax=Mycena chlorophos TaxID=658473 RepID=A0ABQ0KZU3_MYCCL|nr:brain protein 44 [Mycena chlorophos]GAT44435.1 predicted protein [Mycena chlorophos]